MKIDEYLRLNSFVVDPFASTNADTEDLLEEYFVPPPYFESVLGQPDKPQSHIVFAPRGGGKSAQRRMIELSSEQGDFLCILHDFFPVNGKDQVQAASLDFHLREISRKLLIAILIHLDEAPAETRLLDKEVKATLVKEAEMQLGTISIEQFGREVQSLKSIGKRASEWLRDHSGPIRPILTAIFKKAELEVPDFSDASTGTGTNPTESWSYRLSRLVAAAASLGYPSVYILVDKIDELPETSADPSLAFALIAPLITNLPVMEMPGVGFKVFLWDRAAEDYIENGGRPDRIKDFTLGWDPEALAGMMSRRLLAHSDNTVVSLNDLLVGDARLDLHQLAARIAHGSPRDMVRFLKEIRDAHLNGSSPTGKFSRQDVFEGLRIFSGHIADERIRKFMPDLLKINAYRFTQGRLANDLLRIRKQSVQAKVAEWRKTGLVEKIAELQDTRNRPQHLYGVTDIRLAIAMRKDLSVESFLDRHAVFCPGCAAMNIADDGPVICSSCQAEFDMHGAVSVLTGCST